MTLLQVAQTYSEDKAKDGGLLGWKRREELNGAFAEVAFKLAKGAMTPAPVKTKFGRATSLPPFHPSQLVKQGPCIGLHCAMPLLARSRAACRPCRSSSVWSEREQYLQSD